MGKREIPDSELSPISALLRQLRKRTGLSTREFAKLIDMKHPSYSSYEARKFKASEIRKEPRERIIAGLLSCGIPKEDVAEIGPIPPDAEATVRAMRRMEERLREGMRAEIAELRNDLLGRKRRA